MGRSIGYIAQIILARVLAPDGFGLFAIGWTFLRFFTIAGHLGLDSGVVKFGAQHWHKNPLKLRSVAIICIGSALLSGLVFGILLYIWAPWLANEFFKKPNLIPILRGFALTFPFAATLRVSAATTSLSGKMFYGAISEDIAQPIIQIILFIILFSMGMGLTASFLSIAISYALSVLVALFYVTKLLSPLLSPERILTDDFFPIFGYSIPAIIGVTLGAFNLWGDRLLVGYFSTESNTGIYQSISIITMFTTIILSGFKISIAPTISRMHDDFDNQGIEILTKSTVRWVLYVAMPVLIFVMLRANIIVTGLFGLAYKDGAAPLLILTVGQMFYVAFGIVDQIFLMTGNQKAWVRISMLVFVLTIVFDAILIPRMQLIGASVVSSAMMLLLGTIAVFRLKHRLGFWLFDIYHTKIAIVSLITAITTYFIAKNITFGFVIGSLITILLIYALFIVFLLLMGIETNDKNILLQLTEASKKYFIRKRTA